MVMNVYFYHLKGSCQFPTLGFVVDQYRKNKMFVSEPFWSLKSLVRKENQEATFTWDKGNIFNESVVDIHKSVCDGHPIGEITSVIGKNTRKM